MSSLQELLAQKQQLDQQIAALQSQARTDAIAKVKALMADHGLTIADLGSKAEKPAKGSGGRKTVAAKYRHPVTGDTWSGRGLQPNWLKSELAQGKKIEDFAI